MHTQDIYLLKKKKKTICVSNAWQWWTCSQNIDKLINHVIFVQLEKSKLNLLTGWTRTKQITKYMSSDPGWTQNVLKYSPMKYITHAHKSIVNQKNTTDECFHTRGTCYKSLQSSVKLVKWANTQMSNNFFLFYVACIYTFPKRIFFPAWENVVYWHMEMAAVTFFFPFYLNPFYINDISSVTDALPSLLMNSTMSVWGALSLP